ncbi:hypothetical protein [Propionicimonas paludicola]|uniref:hypothetical protein n=1 Tax=Propionicimonas paludicola TaxID=185243 RepID=UPI0014759EC1|nr:hypothetical protein [Propionicimonas paludicola]
MIAVVHAESLTIRRRPEDVAVVSRRRLTGFLSGFRPILSQDQVEYAFGLARLGSDWR